MPTVKLRIKERKPTSVTLAATTDGLEHPMRFVWYLNGVRQKPTDDSEVSVSAPGMYVVQVLDATGTAVVADNTIVVMPEWFD